MTDAPVSVLDASALLCFLLGESGADLVEGQLEQPSVCSAANWSEVAQKTLAHGRNWTAARALLLGYDLTIEPVTPADAEHAAGLWNERPQLSLADRLCLATAHRLGATAWTADRTWGESDLIRQVR